MNILQWLEKGTKLRAAEMSGGLEAREQTLIRLFLKEALANVLKSHGLLCSHWDIAHRPNTNQDRRSQIKFVLELRDINMRVDHAVLVRFFKFLNNVCQPFEMFLSSRHPDEVHLR